MRRYGIYTLVSILISTTAHAASVDATAKALRLSNTITGGLLDTGEAVFTQMVSRIEANDLEGAAALAANTPHFNKYLARRLAIQMQTPALDASQGIDNDATAFIVAHIIGGAGTKPSISTLWSEDATYLVNVAGVPTRAASLTPAQLDAVNWTTDLVRQPGQSVKNAANAVIALPRKHVGGYTTLSDRVNDQSYAMYGATAGTNLRFIEGIYEVATGMSLVEVSSTNALVQDVPRFIPQNDPNFFQGQGQAACISCHGGGMSSANHGYATVADIFDFNGNGFTYIENPTNATRKSLGSDPAKRAGVATCNLAANPQPVCNPDGSIADVNQSWNVGTTWSSSGVLTTMGWTGPTSGQGLNELGLALGQASIVYEFLTKRVINEVCPLGSFTAAQVAKIGKAANPFAIPAGTDDLRTIVAMVASNPSCM